MNPERLRTHADDPESERFDAMTVVMACDEVLTGGPQALPPLVHCGPMRERA